MSKRRVPVLLPDLGTDRVRFSLWYVQKGHLTFEGDRIAEVLIPGATFDIPAPATGILIERDAHSNDHLGPGQVLGIIEEKE